MLASVAGLILALAFPKQSKFLVTSYTAAQQYRMCTLRCPVELFCCFCCLFDLWLKKNYKSGLVLSGSVRTVCSLRLVKKRKKKKKIR